MKTEIQELISNTEINNNEEELILAFPAELYDEAKAIAQSTKTDELFAFEIHYSALQKDFMLSIYLVYSFKKL